MQAMAAMPLMQATAWGGQVPLIQATERFKGTQMGNVIFWLSIMLGQVPASPQRVGIGCPLPSADYRESQPACYQPPCCSPLVQGCTGPGPGRCVRFQPLAHAQSRTPCRSIHGLVAPAKPAPRRPCVWGGARPGTAWAASRKVLGVRVRLSGVWRVLWLTGMFAWTDWGVVCSP
jgi:hypothetical protein